MPGPNGPAPAGRPSWWEEELGFTPPDLTIGPPVPPEIEAQNAADMTKRVADDSNAKLLIGVAVVFVLILAIGAVRNG